MASVVSGNESGKRIEWRKHDVNPASRTRREDELERLKTITKNGLGLRLVWQPDKEGPLSGEVKGKTVYIYESDEGKALEIIKHEFVDYLISSSSEYYKLISNALIKTVNRIAYLEKESTVEALMALLKEEH